MYCEAETLLQQFQIDLNLEEYSHAFLGIILLYMFDHQHVLINFFSFFSF